MLLNVRPCVWELVCFSAKWRNEPGCCQGDSGRETLGHRNGYLRASLLHIRPATVVTALKSMSLLKPDALQYYTFSIFSLLKFAHQICRFDKMEYHSGTHLDCHVTTYPAPGFNYMAYCCRYQEDSI